ncbi:ABC transporter substrate-binding protein [Psychrobium sp. 1_MG-2023]|uniref:ABC transporter substrate-binding protein n=1 Tax=Psychrobium sp. 1_MG-2023 TaxID=3062624 RepID=UPI002733B013|nr:ABC transporter substrate-binding protein [Psychrobium sp. 1_MG-2023]MDP2560776.1 ABC transporter substrate-binding protein [Psychrobium sp. 1_MG-2023]
MIKILSCSLICCFILFFNQQAFGETKLVKAEPKQFHVMIFSPSTQDNKFWRNVISFAQAAADDLHIQLSINYSDIINRKLYLQRVEQALAVPEEQRPDAIIAVSYRKVTKKILSLSHYYNVPVIMVNNSLPEEDSSFIGPPRSRYKTYLGHITPNEQNSGYLLANYLIKQASLSSPEQRVTVAGIGGSREAPESLSRYNGLMMAVSENNSSLTQMVFSNWEGDIAYKQASSLLRRYDPLHIIWCASDLLAINTQKAINEHSRTVITGGIDWTKAGVQAVLDGELSASVGGHFANTGFAVILLHDYLHGKDFADVMPLMLITESKLLTQDNAKQYAKHLLAQDWSSIDFKSYSRVYKPENTSYDFSINYLFSLLEKEQKLPHNKKKQSHYTYTHLSKITQH